MIATHARDSLDRMVVRSLQDTFPTPQGPPPEVLTEDSACPGDASHMVLLMIASHAFRVVLALHFPRTAKAMQYLVPQAQADADADAHGQAFRDGMSERGNMCCGMVNRELGRFYAHTGMSTPHLIDGRSAPHLKTLAHDHLQHFRVQIDDDIAIRASLCVHTREPMEFEWHGEEQTEASGELELF